MTRIDHSEPIRFRGSFYYLKALLEGLLHVLFLVLSHICLLGSLISRHSSLTSTEPYAFVGCFL
jgi:hypothetical protein